MSARIVSILGRRSRGVLDPYRAAFHTLASRAVAERYADQVESASAAVAPDRARDFVAENAPGQIRMAAFAHEVNRRRRIGAVRESREHA
jgi:hypothetical protein